MMKISVALALVALSAAPALAQDQSEIVRGKVLTTEGDCVACHTAPGGTPFAGGLPFKTPMGTIYSPNITPDKDTGIGTWTDAEFLRALHQGIGKNGEHLYPAFPYTSFAAISDGDVAAIKAYLFSLKPVHQQNTPNEMVFPYNIRSLMIGWNLLNFHPETIDPVTERGKYVADALEHCAECHSPRGLTMGVESGKYLAGATVDGWTAYNITSDPDHGIGTWSVDDIKTYLKTGNLPGKAQAAGPMGEVIVNSTSHMPDADLTALAEYLKTVHGQADGAAGRSAMGGPVGSGEALTGYRATQGKGASEGEVLFTAACSTCHGTGGAGEGSGVLPSLYHNSVTGADTPNNLALAVLNGVKRGTAFNDASMPAFRDEFSDEQVAAVTDYVRKTFGNAANPITVQQVSDLRNDVTPPAAISVLMRWAEIAAGIVAVLVVLAIVILVLRRRRV
ncbi:cytochrome c [Acidisoma silvae]|uniref:Cytochrome c n=1 Tax=Acidisoma silvae TaxID=2802396 RepID=A0A964DZ59_9PROT|nr:cytochrome c [Acidisoma silvae]MCB8875926.1 cytochrome c [Acidisoma silvae]